MQQAKGKTHLFNHPHSVTSTNIRAEQAIRNVKADPLEHTLSSLAFATFTFDILVDSHIFILIVFFRLNNSWTVLLFNICSLITTAATAAPFETLNLALYKTVEEGHHLRVLLHALAAVVMADQGVAAHHQSDVLVVAVHLPVPSRFSGATPGLGQGQSAPQLHHLLHPRGGYHSSAMVVPHLNSIKDMIKDSQ